jgi:hypothetical protein
MKASSANWYTKLSSVYYPYSHDQDSEKANQYTKLTLVYYPYCHDQDSEKAK